MEFIRVFARKTNMTPDDEYSFFDIPPFKEFLPSFDEVHIVVVFTWDIERGKQLQQAWQDVTDKPVRIGGPAFDDPCTGEFVLGRYVKNGVIFTSRGCPNSCKFCLVPRREGKIRECEIKEGNIIQDNNFLACSKEHRQKVYDMLKTQRQISFRGGLEPSRLTDWDIEEMRGLKISDVWLACDTKNSIKNLQLACDRLHQAGFNQNKIRCYVLIGDDMQENENRLTAVFMAGALPFAQLFQPPEWIEYSKEWKRFARTWSRPAAYKAHIRGEHLESK